MLRRPATLAAAAVLGPLAGIALVPDRGEDAPSGMAVLSLLPAALAALPVPPEPRQASYEKVVDGPAGADVHLCGVCHVEPASVSAARAAVLRAHTAGGLATVALECDTYTLQLVRAARKPLSGLPRTQVRDEGSGLVRRALFETPAVHMRAREVGAHLTSPSQVGLPPLLLRHLERDGLLWSEEMAAAADAADEVGARVVCLKPSQISWVPEGHDDRSGGGGASLLGMAAYWLQAHALHGRRVDERSCAAGGVEATRTAMAATLPREFSRRVATPDEVMARQLHALRSEVAAGAADYDSQSGSRTKRASIVAIVGAIHVPGVRNHLVNGPS